MYILDHADNRHGSLGRRKTINHSYGLVKTKLAAGRSRRGNSLRWVLDMKEFEQWQTSESGTPESVLWIQGGPGIGKTTMTAYFIDYLRSTFPHSIVAYFFCNRGEIGQASTCDILGTLAYQLAVASPSI